MEVDLQNPAQQITRLQCCINDLVNILALPAVWSGRQCSEIVETLVDALFSMLGLDVACVRLKDPISGVPIQAVRVEPNLKSQPEQITDKLNQLLGEDPQAWPALVTTRVEDRNISIVSSQLGMQGEIGVIMAGSQRADFPRQTESLLLGVAANQASIALQDSRLLSEQRRVAAELDQKVAQRTAELAAINEELRKEIEEHKLTEERLRRNEDDLRDANTRVLRNEQRWRSVFENSAIGVALTDLNGRFIATNPVYQKMLGYTGEELQQLSFLDITVEEFRDRNWTLVKDLLEGKRRQFQIEKQYRRKDGSLVWVRNSISVVPGTKRVPRFIMALSEDIEERKQAEEALRASERKLWQVIDTIPALAWCSMPDGPNEFLNKRWHDYTGLTHEQSVGWGWQVVFHPEDLRPIMDKWQKMLVSGEPDEIESRLRGRDGIYRWFLIRGEPFRDDTGKIVRWYGTCTDIDDRKRAEEKLRRSEAFLAEGQHLSLTGSFSWRLASGEITWSEQLYRMYDFEIGVPVTLELIRTRVHPEDLTLYEKMMEQARSGSEDFEWQYRLLMPDHSIKYLHAVARATWDQDGQLEYIASIQDVTARRLSEDARNKAQWELAHVARAMSLGTMTASIAHELNQPLSGIVTNASTCMRMLASDPPNIKGARETARRTIRDGNRASDVVTRLRALFSKKESAVEFVDLNDVTREVIALSSNELQRKRVTLQHELADNLPAVTGDRVQLQQVILNLLRNASDAMNTVNDRPRELLIRTQRDQGDQVRLSVKDAGVGFDSQVIERLFDAFYTTKANGMGIGLSVSRSIIENHHGRLWASLNDGPGATFTLSIPCRSDDEIDPGGSVQTRAA